MGTLFEVKGTLGSIVEQLETVENIITPAQLTADVNNYNPTGYNSSTDW